MKKYCYVILLFLSWNAFGDKGTFFTLSEVGKLFVKKQDLVERVCKSEDYPPLPLEEGEKLPFICTYLYRDFKKMATVSRINNYREYEKEMDFILQQHYEVFNDNIYPLLTPLNNSDYFFEYLKNRSHIANEVYYKYGIDLSSFYVSLCEEELVGKMMQSNVGYQEFFWNTKGFTPRQFMERRCKK
jgi:hypothetical protein